MCEIYIRDYCTNGDLWMDRETANPIKQEIIRKFKGQKSAIMLQNFSGIEQITFSAVSEIIGGCIRDGINVVITGLNELTEEIIDISFRNPKEQYCCIVIGDADWKLLGAYSRADLDTIEKVIEYGEVETSELSKALNITVASCNNRLKTLLQLGLVKREEMIAPSGGKQYKYFSLLQILGLTGQYENVTI